MKKEKIYELSKNKNVAKVLARRNVISKVLNEDSDELFNKLLKEYRGEEFEKDKKLADFLRKDFYFSLLHYKIKPIEYFLYDFENLSDYGRKQFVGNVERYEFMYSLPHLEFKQTLTDKYKCYQKFKKYYGREMIYIKGEESKNEFLDFCKRHTKYIIKPFDTSQGYGIRVVDLEKDDQNEIWNYICGGRFVLEELIRQDERMARLHPQSVNTIRIATYIKEKKVNILFAVVRMGRGGSVVDNASAGGVVGSIDIDTGIIYSIGKTERGEKCILHPDTGVCIPGFQIPEWDKLKEIVKDLGTQVKDYPYISWDFALQDGKWVMVEANGEGGFVLQQMFGKKLRKILRDVNAWK